MKNKKLLASLLLAIFSVFVLIACKEEKGKYTVNFEVNGGSSISAITTDGNVTRPADPTREGYEFVGWYEDIDLTDPFDFETETVDSNTTLYAKWSEANPKPDIADKFYTVAELIDMCADYTDAPSNDRYYVIATVKEISDAEYGQMTIEDETGEMLVYGTYSADGEIRYSELTEKPVAGDQVILYGTLQQYGETPEIKSGWIIWFNHIETRYRITFETNGGTSVEDVIVVDGEMTIPANPTKEGYTFAGWYQDSALTKPFNLASDTVTANMTLYAKWSEGSGSTEEEYYTIAEIIELCKDFVESPSEEKYSIKATIDEITNTTYGNMTVSDETGSLTIYGCYLEDGTRFDKMDPQPQVGDTLVFYGVIQNYGGNKPEIIDAVLVGYEIELPDVEVPSDPIDPSVDKEDLVTVAELIEMCKDYPNEASTERFYVQAVVISIDDPQFGEMTIADSTGKISVYGTYGSDGVDRYPALVERPEEGDVVLLYANINTFNGEPQIKSGWIINFETDREPFDPADYVEMSIADAREEAVDSKVLLEGVVAQLTYNASKNPIGFILVDETSSIYVYDMPAANQVKIGNKIKIAGSRDNWILDTEQTSAEKYGYDGCIQIADCRILENDNATNDWDKSWVEESTVREMINADPSIENITTMIFKVNALVKKVVSTGYTNYYFNDIDGITGTYTYTQASGADFSWLDEFDGKICTVYLMIINYKSEAAGLITRFLPIEVIDENYQFDLTKTAEMVMEYYVVDQFNVNTYYADPALELVNSVSNELLGFENVTVSYTSNDDAIKINNIDGKSIMNINCSDNKDAIVTATVTCDNQTISKEFTIHIGSLADFKYISISQAIAAKVGEEITVRGIVGPSLVNRDGFYLMSEEGLIAVVTNTDTLKGLSLGDEVIMTGKRDAFGTEEGFDGPGQTCITNATLEVNLYGNNEIPTNFFIEGKTIKDLSELDYTEDHTTEVYLVKAKIEVEETTYYSNIYINDPLNAGASIRLYSSSAKQYSWLFDFAGQEVTLAIAPCNWNHKNYYTGCALYAIDAAGNIIYNTLNFN